MKALTIGGATVDIIASVADHNLERMTMHNAISNFLLLEEGKKVEAHSIDFYIGGGACNAAVSMARRGMDVACLIKIGNDMEGQKIQDKLRMENVDTRPILLEESEPTGRAVMIASHAKNPTIFVARGANTKLIREDITESMFANKELVYVTGLSGESADCFEDIVTYAAAQGAMVACNPGIRQLASRSRAFYNVLHKINFLTLNEVETAQLIPELSVSATEKEAFIPETPIEEENLPRLLKNGLEKDGFAMTLQTLFNALLERGVERFLLTDGKYGAYLVDKDGLIFCPIQKTDVRGTAGAGDSFASTCASELAAGSDPEIALKKAAINASAVVSCVDAQSGLLSNQDLEARMKITVWDDLMRFNWA